MIMNIWKGSAAVAALTGSAYALSTLEPVKAIGFSTLILAIVIGATINNTVGTPAALRDGIRFWAKEGLRLSVILLGFRLSLAEVGALGFQALSLVILVSAGTLFFTRYLGRKMGVSDGLSLLLGSGISICGAAAVAAVSSTTKSREEDVAYSIGTVTLFGTLYMFLYPVLYRMLDLNTMAYSMWAGSSIHEVAQVVAAGFAVSPDAGEAATIVKLTRVLFIIPVTLYLSMRSGAAVEAAVAGEKKKAVIPWFVLLFLAAVAVNSFVPIPKGIQSGILLIDGWLMTAAMAALGLDLSISGIRRVGIRPLTLGLISSLFISGLSMGLLLLQTIYKG